MTTNVLFVCGSLNQTTMMHAISRQMSEFNCYFTPFYADGLLGLLSKLGLLNFTILGGAHRRATERYLRENHLPMDFGGKAHSYDLVVTCTDTLIQRNLLGKRIVLIQEGMTEPEGPAYHLVRTLRLPRYLANTAATGLSDAYEVFCVASPGYRDLFIRKGVKPEKIAVTGIPNFDNATSYLKNDFPYRGFVLAATTCARENFKPDDRPTFIRKCLKIAAGRQLIFKLHPNENFERARREIEQYAPGALIFTDGNVHEMIANCDVLITQYSSVVYTGIALGKEVHSYFDLDELKRLAPMQNNGASAGRIADVCRRLLNQPQPKRARQPVPKLFPESWFRW
jgi:hypothetical protein